MKTKIKRLLIANRGEIACRIIKTAKQLDIKTFAVYSSADQNAHHTQLADHAIYIGQANSADSYLNIDKIITISQENHIDAIHPGYGFLSENPAFSNACEQAGIIFIGPNARTLAITGDKTQTKAFAKTQSVALFPDIDANNPSSYVFPLLIKPAHGGGGKAMTVVYEKNCIDDAINNTKKAAKRYFGNDEVLIEPYYPNARHIEIQIVSDQHGNIHCLGSRECTLQRRFQKVIEESPASSVPNALLNQMESDAKKLITGLQLIGLATVEYLVSQDKVFFLEINPRIQVEHPVTEVTHGLDLVAWQLRVHQGEAFLPPNTNHHPNYAIEARVCAEDVSKQCQPSSGESLIFALPELSPSLRIDSGLNQQDTIPDNYDSLMMKVIASGQSREEALTKLRAALQQCHISGVKTNLSLLLYLTSDNAVNENTVHTKLVDEYLEQSNFLIEDIVFHLAYSLLKSKPSSPGFTPWLTLANLQYFYDDGRAVIARIDAKKNTITMNSIEYDISKLAYSKNSVTFETNGKTYHFVSHPHPSKKATVIFCQGHSKVLSSVPQVITDARNSNQHLAPSSGLVTQVCVTTGDKVKKNQTLVIVESMKMEYAITAHFDGTIKTVSCSPQQHVKANVSLVDLEKCDACGN